MRNDGKGDKNMTLSAIWSPVRVAWTDENAPSDLAIGNAERLLAALAVSGHLPDWAGRGDWPTVCLNWTSAKVEIEVFDDVYELCQFDPDAHSTVMVFEYAATPSGIDDLISAMRFNDQLQPG
jgi:hypothetical protein